jgi:hypothetical protein
MMTTSSHPYRVSRDGGARSNRAWMGAVMLAGLLTYAGTSTGANREDMTKAGTLDIEQYQVAWIGSGNMGGGKLQFGGKTYKFSIGGLGIGGFGVSKVTATGEVYNMKDVAQFPGAYGQARYGFAAGEASKGELWLENPNGVVIHLKAQRVGLALSLGADAIYIKLES